MRSWGIAEFVLSLLMSVVELGRRVILILGQDGGAFRSCPWAKGKLWRPSSFQQILRAILPNFTFILRCLTLRLPRRFTSYRIMRTWGLHICLFHTGRFVFSGRYQPGCSAIFDLEVRM